MMPGCVIWEQVFFQCGLLGGQVGALRLPTLHSAHRNPFVGRVSAAHPPFKSHSPTRR